MTKAELKKIMGENLRRIRQQKKFSLCALATYMDISPAYLGLIERGKRGLTAMMIYRAAEAFGLPISSIYDCEEYRENIRVKR